MAAGSVLTVTKLNEYVSSILSNEPRLRNVKVSGEISGFKRHSSGHLYFNLKDPGAVVSCVMFRSDALKLRFEPEDGMKAVVKGSVSLYVKDGRYQLYASSIEKEGEGELYLAFLQLKEKLQAQGVFDNNRPLPVLPRCIGIATSDTGAALRDMLNIIHRRFPAMNVLFAPCRVQGDGAAEEIAAAINALQRFDSCDVIIAGRGGGSYEDLYCFNDETLARTVAACKVPIVSAVGHETDFTIADFAADLRAPTPSAAAELCCPIFSDLAYGLDDLCGSLKQYAADRLAFEKRNITGLMGSAAVSTPRHALSLMRQLLLRKLSSINNLAEKRLTGCRASLDSSIESIGSLSPNRLKERGFAFITDTAGAPVCSISGLRRGRDVFIHMLGGTAEATVNDIKSE